MTRTVIIVTLVALNCMGVCRGGPGEDLLKEAESLRGNPIHERERRNYFLEEVVPAVRNYRPIEVPDTFSPKIFYIIQQDGEVKKSVAWIGIRHSLMEVIFPEGIPPEMLAEIRNSYPDHWVVLKNTLINVFHTVRSRS